MMNIACEGMDLRSMASGGLEPPTYGLGNRRSIHLSYEVRIDCWLPPKNAQEGV